MPERKPIAMKLLLALIILVPISASAWDGRLRGSGEYVEIDSGNMVREGETIEYYNRDTVETREAEVESVTDGVGVTVVELTDKESGETRVLEME